MWKTIAMLALALACALPAFAMEPERTVSGTSVTSTHDPRMRIDLPSTAKYVGADRWLLLGFDDCEMHLFVDADADKRIQRLYWVQFEAYIPSKPEAKYDYDSPRHVELGGLNFFLDTWARREDGKSRTGSDREHIEKMIRDHGFKMPAQMTYARLVHLPTPDKRKELMIIYGETLPDSVNALDVDENPAKRAQWQQIDKALVEHAKQRLTLTKPKEEFP